MRFGPLSPRIQKRGRSAARRTSHGKVRIFLFLDVSLHRDSADNLSRSVEGLLRYLPDRRQKLLGALEAFHIIPVQSHRHVALSDTSSDSLRGIPDAPFSSLTPEQLVLCAQVVDTALFKSYLVVRPGLLGPLCRRDNWCEVAEVEETLAAREVRPSSHSFPFIVWIN
jgi:hypothetical protein